MVLILLIRCLESEKVDRIFGIPGEENMDVIDSLGSIRYRLYPDEARIIGRVHGRHGRTPSHVSRVYV